MSNIEFDTPANRVISQFAPKNKFRIDTSLPDMALLRQLSVQGRLRYNFGTDASSAAADLITITPTTGETVFIYRIVYQTNSSADQDITYRNAGVLRESYSFSIAKGSQLISDGFVDSLVGNDSDSIIIRAASASAGTRTANVFSWIENTSRIRDVTT